MSDQAPNWNTSLSDGYWDLTNTGRFSRTQEEILAHADRPILRYMSLAKFVLLLSSKSLHFTRLDKFADIHEGSLSQPVYQYHLKTYQDHIASGRTDRSKRLARELRTRGDTFAEAYAESRTALEIAVGTKWAREHVLANCWHGSTVESMAMWAGYGIDGVAIRSTIGNLGSALYPNDLEIQPVYYIDFEKDEMDYGFSYLFKSRVFAYEQEVRALMILPEDESAPPCWDVKVVIPNLVTSVVLAPTAGSMQKEAVTSLLKQYGFSQIPVEASTSNTSPRFRERIDRYMNRLSTKSREEVMQEIMNELNNGSDTSSS